MPRRQDDVEQPVGREEGGARREHVPDAPRGPDARGIEVAHEVEPLFQDLLRVRADLAPAEARGVGRGEDGADRGAGDDLGAQAQLVEGFEDGDVRKPARAAAAERQRDRGRSRAAAARAAAMGTG